MSSQRIHYLDIAKGIFILLLILHHLNNASFSYGVWTPYFQYVNKWQSLYTAFFMQGFFLVSGYCSNFSKELVPFIKTNAKQLLLPVLTFSISLSIIESLFNHDVGILKRLFEWKYWLFGTHLWFLYALFGAKIIVWIYKKYIKKTIFCLLLSGACIYLGVFLKSFYETMNFFCIFHVLVSILFVYIGAILREYNKIYHSIIKWLWVPYIPVLIVIKALEFDIPSVTAGIWITSKDVPVFILLATSGTFLALRFCQIIKENPFLEFFGRNSLIVYGFHYAYIGLMANWISKIFMPETMLGGLLFISLLVASVVSLCYLTILVLNSTSLKFTIGRF